MPDDTVSGDTEFSGELVEEPDSFDKGSFDDGNSGFAFGLTALLITPKS
jgi:hypothetical protein